MKPLWVLLGATGMGKTELAMSLARDYPLTLISVDSALVYRGMDIGTAKPSQEALRAFPHHGVDIRDPDQSFDVAQFLALAQVAVEQAWAKGRIPLMVGGTMMYIQALLQGVAPTPAVDSGIRQALLVRGQTAGWSALWQELHSVDPALAQRLAPNDGQRIVRGLSVYLSCKQRLSDLQKLAKPLFPDAQVHSLGLWPEDRPAHHHLLHQRLAGMLSDGLVDEVEQLYRHYPHLTPGHPSMKSVGYFEVSGYLQGRWDYPAMVARVEAATRQLCKRQLTWMRRMPDLETATNRVDARALVDAWASKRGF